MKKQTKQPKKTKKYPWEKPNSYGELPGDICCMRATGGICYEHNPINYPNIKKPK